MRRSKRIYILLGVLVAVCAVTFGVMRYEEKQEQIKNSDEIILELESGSVQSLAWEYESEDDGETVALAFHKDESWLYDEDEAFPVDEEKITALLEQFEQFGVSFIIEDVEDYGQYGLDDPVCTIDLATEEESYEIQLGNYSNLDEERYVNIGDGNVYLVSDDPMEQFEITLSDLIRHDEAPVLSASAATVTGITFEGAQNLSIVYDEENESAYTEDDVYVLQQDGASLPVDPSNMQSYVSAVSYLDLTDYVTYNATEEELAQYGMDSPELTVTVDYTYEEDDEEVSKTFVLSVSRDPEQLAAQKEEEASEETEDSSAETDSEEEEITAYARVGESQIVYQITAEDYEALMAASYDDLRYQKVFAADFADAYQVDITLEDEVYTLTAVTDEESEEKTWYYQEEEIELTNFQTALKNLTAAEFTDEKPSDKEEISLTVYLDNENYPEIAIGLYRYDGTNCLAVVDSEPVCFVARSGVSDLIEAVWGIVLK